MRANNHRDLEIDASTLLVEAVKKAVANAKIHRPELVNYIQPLATEVIRELEGYTRWGKEPN
jgi:hypothetical protein